MDVGEVAQGRVALFLVLQPGKRGGGLAAVFLVHPGLDVPGGCVLPVVACDRQDGRSATSSSSASGTGSPQAAGSRRHVTSLAAIACVHPA